MAHRPNQSLYLKLALTAALAAFIGLHLEYDIHGHLSLTELKRVHQELRAYYHAHPGLVIGAFVTSYVISVAASLPTATILTLAAGDLFGLFLGTLLVSIASTVGATLAFWVSRYLIGGFVQNRFQRELNVIYRKIEEEGAFYLFALRLNPIFPFFLVNLVTALTPVKSTVFFFVSQLAMLPGTIVYVNAGTALGRLNSMRDVLSFRVLIAFAVLGLLPLVAKRIVDVLRARQIPIAEPVPTIQETER